MVCKYLKVLPSVVRRQNLGDLFVNLPEGERLQNGENFARQCVAYGAF